MKRRAFLKGLAYVLCAPLIPIAASTELGLADSATWDAAGGSLGEFSYGVIYDVNGAILSCLTKITNDMREDLGGFLYRDTMKITLLDGGA
jgi:hypothetical protein